MKGIKSIIEATLTGGRRDKVFITLIFISVLSFLIVIPAASSMSMRQVREVAVGLSLSTISLVSLVLTIFLGVTLVYKDIERRILHSVLSLPLSRESYLVGKFLGLAAIIAAGEFILAVFSVAGIMIASRIYQSDIPMLWGNYLCAVASDYMKLLIIASCSVFFSSLSTNIFLPLFAGISVYIIGNITQPVMDYINSPYGQKLPAFSVFISKAAYYLFPNLTAFDLKFKAVYSLPLPVRDMLPVFAYAVLYVIVVLSCAVLVFRRRDIT